MIFYFSCTGNTRWAAETLGQRLGERLIDMASAAADEPYSLEAGERIGFCFPVHGWRPPQLVRAFIGKLQITNATDHYCWALCTAGDDIGQTMELLNRDLSIRGLKATSLFSLIMPESFVGLPFMDVDRPEKELAKITTARQQLEQFATLISQRREPLTLTYKGHWPRINSHVIGEAFVRWIITDRPFRVTDDCITCGTCASVCPVNNIEVQPGQPPTWKHNGQCLTCFACYHHCPTRAIRFGHRTEKKGQYYFKEL